jgi:hypothetical protein
MVDDWTCGKGLAANAGLPEAVGTVFDALAVVLDLHTRSLDLGEDSGRAEYDAYVRLIAQQRAIAFSLATLAREMAGYATKCCPPSPPARILRMEGQPICNGGRPCR